MSGSVHFQLFFPLRLQESQCGLAANDCCHVNGQDPLQVAVDLDALFAVHIMEVVEPHETRPGLFRNISRFAEISMEKCKESRSRLRFQ